MGLPGTLARNQHGRPSSQTTLAVGRPELYRKPGDVQLLPEMVSETSAVHEDRPSRRFEVE